MDNRELQLIEEILLLQDLVEELNNKILELESSIQVLLVLGLTERNRDIKSLGTIHLN